jgi:sugar-phosphatase
VDDLGLLFDCDGVLVDSHRVVELAWAQLADEYSLDLDAMMAVLPGRPASATVNDFVVPERRAEAQARIDEIELGLAAEVTGIPGARALLESLDRSTWVVATSGGRELTLAKLRAAELPDPPALVTADDVRRGKPDPEPYLLAASLLSLPASRCAVFEDSVAGLEAARAAGAGVVVGVGPVARESGLADVVVADLTEVPGLLPTLGDLRT